MEFAETKNSGYNVFCFFIGFEKSTWKGLGEIIHEGWIKGRNHVEAIQE
jgi:hypothetical protein